MKIYNNVLQQSTIEEIFKETRNAHRTAEWAFSTLAWSTDIQVGAMAATACKPVSEELATAIEGQIQQYLPEYTELKSQIYLWPRGSSISCHDDAHCKFGATIYLNSHWHVDYGGLFVWQDNASKEWKVRFPEFNTMVLNDEQEPHLVTPVSYASMEMRHTVQIWGF